MMLFSAKVSNASGEGQIEQSHDTGDFHNDGHIYCSTKGLDIRLVTQSPSPSGLYGQQELKSPTPKELFPLGWGGIPRSA